MAHPDYPQSEKLASIQDERVAIIEFLEWLEDDKSADIYIPGPIRTQDSLIMEFFGIDEKELENERRAMLASPRGESR